MFGALARRLFGSANDRYIKSLGPLVDQINELEPELEKLSDEALRARTAEFKTAARRRRRTRRSAGRGVRDGARGREAHAGPAPFRRAADGRDRAASRHDRRDEDRRRQDAGRDLAGLSQCAGRQGRACRHGQRLPGEARRRVDGADLPASRPDGRLHRPRARRLCSARRPISATSPTAPTTSSASTICATT